MDYSRFKGAKVLVTGATGLIGKALVKKLIDIGDVNVVAFVRNLKKAETIFAEEMENGVSFLVGDVRFFDFSKLDGYFDYIVHAASETSSKAFVEAPIDVSLGAVEGTRNVLELAAKCNAKKVIYLSSMEVYGTPTNDDKVYEDSATNINTMSTRSSYPESKRMCESLCCSFFSQKNVPAVVLRLTQTFGPGVNYEDSRVFAEFARCAIEGRDIVLKTKGETKRSYLHVDDAVDAILVALIAGQPGEAYNVANENTYCSIYEMASLVAGNIAKNCIAVKIEECDITECGYAPTLKMNLDTQKMCSLGWSPQYGLMEMYEDVINGMRV